MNESRNRQFGLKSILALVALIACGLGGIAQSYRMGKQSGYSLGYATGLAGRFTEGNTITIEYQVDDVIRNFHHDPESAAKKLAKKIYETAKPETWDIVGGYGSIKIREANKYTEMFIEVSNTVNAHLEVSRLLDDIRGAAPGVRDRSLVKHLYEEPTRQSPLTQEK